MVVSFSNPGSMFFSEPPLAYAIMIVAERPKLLATSVIVMLPFNSGFARSFQEVGTGRFFSFTISLL
ncbi:Uncharacterised protein [Mycobacterium tuberculosis]|nr:Uncharacterised protein [Mycobacterium tuberculosis]